MKGHIKERFVGGPVNHVQKFRHFDLHFRDKSPNVSDL